MIKKTTNKKVTVVTILSVIALIVTVTGFSLKDLLFNCKSNKIETPVKYDTGNNSVIINGDRNVVESKNISIDSSNINKSIINTGTVNGTPTNCDTK